MKNRLMKLLGITFIVSLVAFNIFSGIKPNKLETTLSSLIITAKANAEGFEECAWKIYSGGCGNFLFCGYEDTWMDECTCGDIIGCL